MEGLRIFLENSTIHGVSYISTTRKNIRLFWTVVVIAGFPGGILLINESFHSWAKSPVKTSLETLPITKLKFPKERNLGKLVG